MKCDPMVGRFQQECGIRLRVKLGTELSEAVLDKVSPHDLHATLLQLLGIDHKRLTFFSQGLPQRLSNVTQPSRIVEEIFA